MRFLTPRYPLYVLKYLDISGLLVDNEIFVPYLEYLLLASIDLESQRDVEQSRGEATRGLFQDY